MSDRITDSAKLAEENNRLCLIIQTSQDTDEVKAAKERLIKLNEGLVQKSAGKLFAMYSENPVYSFDDAYQEGCIGLLRAAETYDPTQAAFSTYAMPWIRQKIGRSCEDASNVSRIPTHAVTFYKKMRKQFGENLTDTEFINKVLADRHLTETQKNDIKMVYEFKYTLSLNRLVGEGDDVDTEMEDLIPADPDETDKNMNAIALKDALTRAVASLGEREKWVIEHRYGIVANMTLDACGKNVPWGEITRERIRQIENNALKKLSIRAGKYGLRDFITA